MQSAYLCVIFHFKHEMAAKIATIFADVKGLQQRHHPQNIPHLVKKIKGFPLKVKSFRNTAYCREGFHLPPPLAPRWGYEFACTSERKTKLLHAIFEKSFWARVFLALTSVKKGMFHVVSRWIYECDLSKRTPCLLFIPFVHDAGVFAYRKERAIYLFNFSAWLTSQTFSSNLFYNLPCKLNCLKGILIWVYVRWNLWKTQLIRVAHSSRTS